MNDNIFDLLIFNCPLISIRTHRVALTILSFVFMNLTMKVLSLIFIIIIIVIIQSINSENNRWNEVVEGFIRSANNKTIAIVSIDNAAESNFQFVTQEHRPRVILKLSHNEWLENCSSYANSEDIHTKLIDILACLEHNDFIIFTSLNALPSALHCIVHPLSRFLLIVTDISTTSPSIIEKLSYLLNTTWMSNGALKVFISTHNNTTYMFNPFHRNDDNDGSFGKLNSLVNFSFDDDGCWDLRQLNGYPMRVELFYSTYAMPLRKPATTIEDFYGPDAHLASLAGKLWNSSGEFLTLINFISNSYCRPS